VPRSRPAPAMFTCLLRAGPLGRRAPRPQARRIPRLWRRVPYYRASRQRRQERTPFESTGHILRASKRLFASAERAVYDEQRDRNAQSPAGRDSLSELHVSDAGHPQVDGLSAEDPTLPRSDAAIGAHVPAGAAKGRVRLTQLTEAACHLTARWDSSVALHGDGRRRRATAPACRLHSDGLPIVQRAELPRRWQCDRRARPANSLRAARLRARVPSYARARKFAALSATARIRPSATGVSSMARSPGGCTSGGRGRSPPRRPPRLGWNRLEPKR
jgi:hypothetical protein